MTTIGHRDTGRATSIGGLAADDYHHDHHGDCDDHRPPLVLLHGMTFDRSMWRDIVPELDRIDPRRRVLALDLPGHGESPEQANYALPEIAQQLHHALQTAGILAPVIVGHSASGLLASVYAARHPTRGVINIDQPLETARFRAFARSLAEDLRGPQFPAVWQQFYDSFHIELLPPAAQDLVRSTCRPRQPVVLGYWREILEESAQAALQATIEQVTATVRATGLPYLLLLGDPIDPDQRSWLANRLPAATIEEWPGTGHFPHLADPARFARLLANTATWPHPA